MMASGSPIDKYARWRYREESKAREDEYTHDVEDGA